MSLIPNVSVIKVFIQKALARLLEENDGVNSAKLVADMALLQVSLLVGGPQIPIFLNAVYLLGIL